jgi:ribonuclease VapC
VIAVDISALMAIVLDEPQAPNCISVLEKEVNVLISAGTMAEAMIVATIRNVATEMKNLISRLEMEIVPVIGSSAMRVAEIYAQWGKGLNPASLNYGDCFAYDVAKVNDCPLLFVGNGFSKTDIQSAI